MNVSRWDQVYVPDNHNDSLQRLELDLSGHFKVLRTFDLWVGLFVPGAFCIAGMVGNALAFVVLSRDRSRSATLLSLQALSLSDFLLLLCALLQQVIPILCLAVHNTRPFCLRQGYVRVYTWPLICMTQMTSVWLTVLISAERCLAICFPLRAIHICSVPRLRQAILIIALFSVAFNIPKFFEFRPEREWDVLLGVSRVVVGSTRLRSSSLYRYLYNTTLQGLVVYALPLSALSVFNVKLVRKLRSAHKNWRLLNRSQRREMKATKLPVVIVFVCFVCGTQSLAAFILDAVFVHYLPWLQIYTAVVNLLVVTNSAVNFVLMYCFGGRFRLMLRRTLCCGRARKEKPRLLHTKHSYQMTDRLIRKGTHPTLLSYSTMEQQL